MIASVKASAHEHDSEPNTDPLNSWQEFAQDNEQMIKDGTRFLRELRAVLGLELQLSKLAVVRLSGWLCGILIFTFLAVLFANSVLGLTLYRIFDNGWMLPLSILFVLNASLLIFCATRVSRYCKLVGTPRTRSLIARTKRPAGVRPNHAV